MTTRQQRRPAPTGRTNGTGWTVATRRRAYYLAELNQMAADLGMTSKADAR